MQLNHHIARRRGFFSGLPWGNDKASFGIKLGASLNSFSHVLCSNRGGSSHLVINGSEIKSRSVPTRYRHWYFSEKLLPKFCSVISSTFKELTNRSFSDTLGVIFDKEKGSFAKCNRWRIPKNRSKSFMSYLDGRIPISQVLIKGGVL